MEHQAFYKLLQDRLKQTLDLLFKRLAVVRGHVDKIPHQTQLFQENRDFYSDYSVAFIPPLARACNDLSKEKLDFTEEQKNSIESLVAECNKLLKLEKGAKNPEGGSLRSTYVCHNVELYLQSVNKMIRIVENRDIE